MRGMFFSIDSVKPFIGPYLHTPEGRAKLLEAFAEPARATLRGAGNDPDIGYTASVQFRIIEAVLGRCDGKEAYDSVAIRSLLGDLKGIADKFGSTPTATDSAAAEQFEDLILFIRTHADGPVWKDPADDDGA